MSIVQKEALEQYPVCDGSNRQIPGEALASRSISSVPLSRPILTHNSPVPHDRPFLHHLCPSSPSSLGFHPNVKPR
ncbi:hypothetical protein RRG08_064003 [Elysia crispata]|uniref:Uncharacterized protein n=1 Tax=Elysia crispata TaxID=231223 RepID=A0AAE0YEW1_9GAST|nr:hypothetical protein RRG08_064003 [Elysia crispata]